MNLIDNPEELEKIIEEIKLGGKGNLHILADFDRTLTKGKMGKEKAPSVIALLRNSNYLGEEYSKKANELFDFYHPIEIDPKISNEDKKQKMDEWWRKHFNLMIESNINKKDIEKVILHGEIVLRKGVKEFLEKTNKNNIPVIIISAGGLGIEAMSLVLEKEQCLFENIHVVSNSFEYNEEGYATKLKEPVITVSNKDETSIKHLDIYPELEKRKNIILLGDSLGDLGMSVGLEHENLLKIGFLNFNIEENKEIFMQNFDVVIPNDPEFDEVNNIFNRIIS